MPRASRNWKRAITMLAVLAMPAPLSAAPDPLRFGAAWYPEQWPEARWGADLDGMRGAHMNVVRIAEFSWSRMEPADGQFDFTWLDRAIDAAASRGIKVVLGTPTAAPPAWLTAAHPDTLRVNEDGSVEGHGGRRQYSWASTTYRRYARRIAEKMAEHFGHNPNVIGWQIDNELGAPSFDKEAQGLWHAWLQKRYGTVDELNRRWTTEYWSQHYDSFDQVPLHSRGQQNPGLLLDFDHFATDTWMGFVAEQAQAIRAHADPRQFVTTNTMHWNLNFDHFRMHRQLDLAAWDNYIPGGRPDWLENGANHDLVRGYKGKNFWVMETQPGRVDWWSVNRALDPGQVREMAWQAVGHGADALLYWQWRSALGGQEQYHGTLVGADGTPLPLFPEIVRTGEEFAKAAPLLAGTSPHAKVAMLFSYDSMWAIKLQPHTKAFDPIAGFVDWYRPLERHAQAVDIVAPDADLSSYPLVVAPSLNVLTQAEADRLAAYVRAGGHLVLGPRTGMKDDANALWPQRQPGPLLPLLGARVEQFYALDAPVKASGSLGDATASIWAEMLTPEAGDVTVVERYGTANGWLDGKPAVMTRKVGKGSVTYVGASFDAATLDRLAAGALGEAGVAPILAGAPDGLEVDERSGGGRRILVLVNHNDAPVRVALPTGARALVGDYTDGGMPAHGVAVIATTGKGDKE
ncbi:MAG TPA: beta-galactosidase [Sphingomonas sp.]